MTKQHKQCLPDPSKESLSLTVCEGPLVAHSAHFEVWFLRLFNDRYRDFSPSQPQPVNDRYGEQQALVWSPWQATSEYLQRLSDCPYQKLNPLLNFYSGHIAGSTNEEGDWFNLDVT